MKKHALVLIGLLFACTCALHAKDRVDPVDYVSILVGTQSKHSLSTGNTYPAVALPWGMNFWSPQTGKMGYGWMYTYDADKIRGFKQTHQPSPWINDYGQFALMPVTSGPDFDQDKRASWFSHKAEVAKPYYYSVYLADHDVSTELSPTERAAIFRFTFPEREHSYVVIDALDKGSYIKIIPSEKKITGYSTKNSGGVPDNFKNYFVIVFDKAFDYRAVFADGNLTVEKEELQAEHVGAVVGFKTKRGEKVHARIASSFIGVEQAEQNLKELANDDIETVPARAKARWPEGLST
jgi:predicted alpha-1,2-mannosidase